jgi:hypothetical protein
MSTYEFSDWSFISGAKITHQQGNIWHNQSVVEAEIVQFRIEHWVALWRIRQCAVIMPYEFRMRYLLSVKYHNIQQQGSLQSIIFRNVSLRNKTITRHWKLPGLRQRLFEKHNKFWAVQNAHNVTRRCVSLFNTSGSSIHSSNTSSNKTVTKEHKKSSVLTVSKTSHTVKSKYETAQQQICSVDCLLKVTQQSIALAFLRSLTKAKTQMRKLKI